MAEYRRAEITSGLFIVMSALLFALFAFKVGGLDLSGFFGGGGSEFHAYFVDVKTLESEAKVAVGGARVGVVSEKSIVVRVDPETGMSRQFVRIGFKIEDGSMLLGDDVVVKVEQEGFIGPFFLSLDAGTWNASRPSTTVAERAKRAPEVPSVPGAGLTDDLFRKLDPQLKKIDRILGAFEDDFLNPEARRDLQRVIPLLARTLDGAQDLLGGFRKMIDPSEADGLQQTVLKPAHRLLARLESGAVRLDDLLRDMGPALGDTLGAAKDAAGEAEKTIAAVRRLLEESEPEIRAMLAEAERLMHELGAQSGKIGPLVDGSQKAVDGAKNALENASGMIEENRSNLAELMRTFRNAAWEAEILVRKLKANPAVLIFGDDEPALEALPRDDSGLRRSGRAKPFGQRDEKATEPPK